MRYPALYPSLLMVLITACAVCFATPSGADLGVNPLTVGVETHPEAVTEAPGLPTLFVPNQGQWSPELRYFARTPGADYYFAEDAVVLQVKTATGRVPVQLRLLDARPTPRIEAGEQLSTHMNILRGNDPALWRTAIPTHAGLQYREIYDGIAWAFRRHEGQALAYDFLLAPGADPRQIQLAVDGVESLSIEADGRLAMHLPGGEVLHQAAPVLYQDIDGERVAVAGGFRLLPVDTGLAYGFNVAAYDARYALVIDPTLQGSTFVGGANDDTAYAMVLLGAAGAGDMIMVGTTESVAADFGAFNGSSPADLLPTTATQAGKDAIVYKLSAGSPFVTILVGDGDDEIYDLAVDAAGNIYVTGMTDSTDFPTDGVADALFPYPPADDENAFIVKLNSAGSSLLFSTYYGGSGNDAGNAIAVASDGSFVFVGGTTASTDLPLEVPRYASPGGGDDGFFLQLAVDVTDNHQTLEFASYFGGSGADSIEDIQVAPTDGDLYLGGTTDSSDFPSKNAIQPDAGGGKDMFLARITQARSGQVGGDLVFSTYLGGSSDDVLTSILLSTEAADNERDVYIGGYTSSSDFDTYFVNNGYVEEALYDDHTGEDGVILKLDKSARFLHFFTYLGGSGDDRVLTLARDQNADGGLYYLYAGGKTASNDFPIRPRLADKNVQTGYSGGDGADGFFLKLDPHGLRLIASSYFGGEAEDEIVSVATPPFDATLPLNSSQLCFVGNTESLAPDQDAAAGRFYNLLDAAQDENAGGIDHFVACATGIDDAGLQTPALVVAFAGDVIPEATPEVSIDLTLDDQNGVGIAAFSATLLYDANELALAAINWDPSNSLPDNTVYQANANIEGQLRLSLYQDNSGGGAIGALTDALTDATIVTVGFNFLNQDLTEALASKLLKLSLSELDASDTNARNVPLYGQTGGILMVRRCNDILGDCDCSGRVQAFEVQEAVVFFLAGAGNAPACVTSNYVDMTDDPPGPPALPTTASNDLATIILNYLNEASDIWVGGLKARARSLRMPIKSTSTVQANALAETETSGIPRLDASLASPVGIQASPVSRLNFSVPRQSGEAVSVDLSLAPTDPIAVLITDILFDPDLVIDATATAGPAAFLADKELVYNLVAPGRLRLLLYGLNREVLPQGVIATIHLTLAEGADLDDLQLTQETNASRPYPRTVIVDGGTLNGSQPDVGSDNPGTGCGLDIDGDGQALALSDGMLLFRYLLGMSGERLTAGAIATDGSRATASAVAYYLRGCESSYDIDGDGYVTASTDALLVMRYLFGFRGAALTTDVVGPAATRTDAAAIEAVLYHLLP